MRRIPLVTGLILLIVLTACNTRADEPGPPPPPPPIDTLKSLTVSDVTLSWRVDSTRLYVKLGGPSTGWVAVGFDPVRQMEGANIIIGYVQSAQAHFRDDFGSGPASHAADTSAGGIDNVTGIGGVESGGRTAIEFTIPLNSGDSRDRVLVAGSTYSVLLSYGNDLADDFDSYHKFRIAASITL